MGGKASGSGSWLSCLRQLYAAVPPEWISTVELVLEQTLHQMPGVAESLLDAIQGASSSSSNSSISKGGSGVAECSGSSGGNTVSSREKRSRCTPTSVGNDLALLILLLREASPLRACSLPLLPIGVDRGRRAEEGVRRILLGASRWDFAGAKTSVGEKDRTPQCRGRVGALHGARALLGEVLCAEPGFIGDAGGGGRDYRGQSGGGSSSGGVITGGGGQSSGVVSERASQLLELALRWLEEGDGGDGVGGEGASAYGKDGGGAEVSIRDVASEIVSAVFDAVVEARPRLLRALLSGVFDRNQSGTACAWSYMRAWEALMAQEAELEVSMRGQLVECQSESPSWN